MLRVGALVAAAEEIEIGAERLDLLGRAQRRRERQPLQGHGPIDREFLAAHAGLRRRDSGLPGVRAHGEELLRAFRSVSERAQEQDVLAQGGRFLVERRRVALQHLGLPRARDARQAPQRILRHRAGGLLQRGRADGGAARLHGVAEAGDHVLGSLMHVPGAGEELRQLIEEGSGHGGVELSAQPRAATTSLRRSCGTISRS